MLFALALTVCLTLGLFLLCALVRMGIHAFCVGRYGAGNVILVAVPDDEALPFRVRAALCQSQCSNLRRCGEVLVLDCGLSMKMKQDCRAAVAPCGRVRFLTEETLLPYLQLGQRQCDDID